MSRLAAEPVVPEQRPSAFDEALELVQDDLEKVDQEFRKNLRSSVPIIGPSESIFFEAAANDFEQNSYCFQRDYADIRREPYLHGRPHRIYSHGHLAA